MMIITPYVYDTVEDIEEPFPFPVLEGFGMGAARELDSEWERIDTEWFVDSSGFGTPGEAALTVDQFIEALRAYVTENPTHGFALTGVGQFQVFVGAFWRIE